MRMKPRILMSLLCFFACGVTAQAGERLFLKAGIIDPITHKLKSQSNATKTNFYILQFERSPSALNYKEMESQKIEWLAYLPDDALIVRLPKD
ncbi:MAG: hypothetical protein KDD40_07300, partial [Bdellovibrionales bacterium]|nr:hypothetical protein [Bdellovibrionales bacterium]